MKREITIYQLKNKPIVFTIDNEKSLEEIKNELQSLYSSPTIMNIELEDQLFIIKPSSITNISVKNIVDSNTDSSDKTHNIKDTEEKPKKRKYKKREKKQKEEVSKNIETSINSEGEKIEDRVSDTNE